MHLGNFPEFYNRKYRLKKCKLSCSIIFKIENALSLGKPDDISNNVIVWIFFWNFD